ncbi:MAG: hypothetical protein IIA72_23845 [Proteobacteria bacterium]|nr:hypothetical protein [Pseudomonadota bacterium]
MKPPEFYRGREQTYLKHFFLEKYLERVAWNILSFRDEFVYVDGFSGPWKSEDEALEDTSFMIALNQLRKVRQGLKERQGAMSGCAASSTIMTSWRTRISRRPLQLSMT